MEQGTDEYEQQCKGMEGAGKSTVNIDVVKEDRREDKIMIDCRREEKEEERKEGR